MFEWTREVTDHPVFSHVAGVGLIGYGAMRLLIAPLAGWLGVGPGGFTRYPDRDPSS
jgi:hypothetical protein